MPVKDKEAQEMILDIGKRIYAKNFVAANDGNISCKVGENAIRITPTGVSKGFMHKEMLIKMDLQGNILEGTHKPSSEYRMHLRVYLENAEVGAVVHAHPPMATAFAVAGIALDQPIYAEALSFLGEVPLAPYGRQGTEAIPEAIAPYCKNYKALLLANHGVLTWGKDLTEAWYRMEAVEHYARILYYTRNLGNANVLNQAEVDYLKSL